MKIKLTDICSPKQWKTIPVDKLLSEGYPVYGANGIIGHYNEYNHEESVVTVTCRGATCGNVNLTNPKAYVTGNAMCLDNLDEKIDIHYLYYCMKSFNFSRIISGSAQPQITRQGLNKVTIEVYPLEKQKQIVSILDTVSGIIGKRKKQLEGLDELVKARFVEMFGDPVENPMGWDVVLIEYCIKSIENGKSFVCDNNTRVGEEPAILKLSSVTYGNFNPNENKKIINENDFVKKAEIHNGDLLFTRKNTPELVGMSAYIFFTPPKLMMPDLIFRLNTKENCNKIFLWKLINHDLFRKRVQNIASGSAKSMSNISKERLKNLSIYLPPIELQNQFADFVKQTEEIKEKVQKSLDETQVLFDKLMQEYFS